MERMEDSPQESLDWGATLRGVLGGKFELTLTVVCKGTSIAKVSSASGYDTRKRGGISRTVAKAPQHIYKQTTPITDKATAAWTIKIASSEYVCRRSCSETHSDSSLSNTDKETRSRGRV